MAKKIKVTVDTGKTLPMNYLEVLQGNLKDLSDDNYKKLRASIIKHGFSFPIFVWENPEDAKIYILDGTQRFTALSKMKEEGYSVPQLPVVFIEATNLNHAKEKLAAAASQYGKFTEEGVASFFADMDFDIGAIEIPFLDFSKVIELDQGKMIEVEAHERLVGHKKNENEYTKKIDAPIYTPKKETPPDLSEIFSVEKYNQLVARIRTSNLDEKIQQFLILASTRHIVFNYELIAEFYCHQDAKIQSLMEESALVIIDFDKAVENGFVKLTDNLEKLLESELESEDEE